MKVGVIVPNSMLFPAAGLHFSNGIELACNLYGYVTDTVVVEDAGQAATDEEVQKAANKLFLKEKVDIIVAYIGHNTFRSLAELCIEHKKILILADMGGVIAYQVPRSEYVFFHSLNEWAAVNKLGSKSAQKHKEGFSALSMMDAGYALGFSYISGFEKGGGKAVGFHVSKMEIDEVYFSTLEQIFSEHQPEHMFCGFVGKDAEAFFEGAKSVLSATISTISGSGWLVLPEVLKNYGQYIIGANTASAYYTTIENDANDLFKKEFEEFADNEVNRFSMLGYEIGMMLFTCAEFKEGGKLDKAGTIKKLETTTIEAPRGKVYYDPKKHYAVSGCWFAEVVESDGQYINQVKENIEVLDMEEWRADSKNWPNGGWLNPFPCT